MNFLGIEPQDNSYTESRSVILPIPYEQTTSYGSGTKNGPQAILEASAYVELYDQELHGEVFRKGIHTAPVLDFCGNADQDFNLISDTVQKYLTDDKFIASLGGEHSISFPIFRAFNNHFENLSVLQLDAHSDLRESYEDSIYSHASVMRRIFELNRNIIQLGIRSQCIEEVQFISEQKINTHFAHEVNQTGFQETLIKPLKDNVYLTIDVDFFDPSIMPSTGTPEPGGFLWYETLNFLKTVFKQRNVVGFDVVELSPIKGLAHPDFFVAKLVHKLIGYKFL